VRAAVIDIGTNSTRLLVAEADGEVSELERHSRVTGLGRGLDTSGHLAAENIESVCTAVGDYLDVVNGHDPDVIVALATSAVRDADNAGAFLAELRERFALDAEVIGGRREAELTYRGATAGREGRDGTLVVDIGGGSTELVVGEGGRISFDASLQLGVVRQSERHLHHDPPSSAEIEELADAAAAELETARQSYPGPGPENGIAVAGTPTSLASIELGLDPYDPAGVEGHELELEAIQHQCSRLSAMPLAERREVNGLHPDRAPTIVSGILILLATMRAFGLERVTVSRHDILWGAALEAADRDGRPA
jgi:exopolyphosphatase / guanosine-5'-triphosphate,3'-diphosphate pyrophosphatase